MTSTIAPHRAKGSHCEFVGFGDGACRSGLAAIHNFQNRDLCAFHSPFDSDKATVEDLDLAEAIANAPIDICTRIDAPTLAAHFTEVDPEEWIKSQQNPFVQAGREVECEDCGGILLISCICEG